jgi:hypothetical protein
LTFCQPDGKELLERVWLNNLFIIHTRRWHEVWHVADNRTAISEFGDLAIILLDRD